jgi:trans-aconitate 2-methyltransferase
MNSKGDKYFYAEVEAGMYDSTIALTTPYYSLAVDSMMDLISFHLRSKVIDNDYFLVLDIGSGTGNESIKILNSYPNCNVLAVDFCEPMKVEFEENYRKSLGKKASIRYEYWIDDFLNTSTEKYTKFLKHQNRNGFDIIITAYTLHHYVKEEKNKFYKSIYSLLANDGLFINVDLFSYQSNELTYFSDEQIISYIKTQFRNPDKMFSEARKVPVERRLMLSEKWVKHYQCDNILSPIEEQRNMLNDIGFTQTGVPFMYFQNGLLWAKK